VRLRSAETISPVGGRQRALSNLRSSGVTRPYVIGFLLPPQFVLLSYAGAVEPLRAANTLSGQALYDWKIITMDGKPVEALAGGRFDPDYAVGDDIALDMLMVCSPPNSANFRDERTFSWLRHIARKGTVLGSFSGGINLLARAGLLDNYRCAVHWERMSAFREEFPNHEISNSIYVIDRNRITCGGGLSAVDLMHAMIEARHGHDLAADVSEWFLHTEIREGRRPQRLSLQARLGVTHAGLIKALEAMERTLEEPLSRVELAGIAGVSERHLDRLFVTQVGAKVSEYYLQLRLGRSHELIIQSNMSLLEIANACGFDRASTFSKSYRKLFGVAPSKDRADALRRWRAKS
jgi:transcriptional regulator GlxA family with amidase domain